MLPDAIIYTDGGYRPSKDLGAWGYVIVNPKNKKAITRASAVKGTTNNRMELGAVVEALRVFKTPDKLILLISDSQYTINSCSKWIQGWKANGWKKNTPGELKNIDILKELDALTEKQKMNYRWVRGHSGNYGNDYVDDLLNKAMDLFQEKGSGEISQQIENWNGSCTL